MLRIDVYGTLGRRPAELRYLDGEVTGTPRALDALDLLVTLGRPVGFGGFPTSPATLDPEHPDAVVATLAAALDRVDTVVGAPDPPPIPDGAVA